MNKKHKYLVLLLSEFMVEWDIQLEGLTRSLT